jgi:hypothetical protein
VNLGQGTLPPRRPRKYGERLTGGVVKSQRAGTAHEGGPAEGGRHQLALFGAGPSTMALIVAGLKGRDALVPR